MKAGTIKRVSDPDLELALSTRSFIPRKGKTRPGNRERERSRFVAMRSVGTAVIPSGGGK
jgi:hypothetical protein